jgi:Predicted molecular chaperone distantly related to HSP70-fold metalloproteases
VSELYIGLMSGTSLDGVDAALVDFSKGRSKLLATHFLPYPDALRAEALALNTPGEDEIHRSSILANDISRLYAEAALALLEDARCEASAIAAIGSHGQTIRHRPDCGYTTQISQPALIAERTGICVVADFRMRDIAAGGQGAPLVPAFHAGCFRDLSRTRVILNLGGIANLTYLPKSDAALGFDTGPGNLLMDMWCLRHQGAVFDAAGAWAASGTVIESLLTDMRNDAYFARQPPKSTGRDDFNERWLARFAPDRFAAADVQATLLELTARTVADAVRRFCPGTQELYACGGGASNAHLLQRLQACLDNVSVTTTAQLGLHPDWVEAVAFAWLARQTVLGLAGNLPEVTGARGSRVLGAIYPA